MIPQIPQVSTNTDGSIPVHVMIYDAPNWTWVAASGSGVGAVVEVENFPTVISGTVVPVNTKTALTPSAPAAVSVGVATTVVLAANANRKGCMLVNTSTAYISLGFGAAAVLYSGVTLNPGGGSYWMDEYCFVVGAINGIASAAASNLGVQEIA